MTTKTLTYAFAAFAIGIGLSAAVFLIFGSHTSAPDIAATEEPRILYWVAPMDPNFRRPSPGKSPMGMDLVPVYEDSETAMGGDSANTVTVSPAMTQSLGIRTALVELRDLERSIRTVGYVAADDDLISHVHVRAEGWIERLPVKAVGESVTKGQTLFEMYAPDIHVAQGEFTHFLQRGEQDMLDITLGRLALLDVPNREIEALRNGAPVQRRTAVLSPISGVVLSQNVGEGMFVKPAMTTMVIADLSSIWVLADVFEDQASWVKPGQDVTLNMTYLPDFTRTGVVDYIYPTVDSMTRTLTARLKFDNPDGVLKPNMFANVQIHTDAVPDTLVVPVEALIRTGVSERVVVALGDGRFKSVEVRSGLENDGYVEIRQGLALSDQVVVSGQFLIDSESNFSASVERLEDNGMGSSDMGSSSMGALP
jgi:Cu(I)/Ag(I) efflux system membrane fusion protein